MMRVAHQWILDNGLARIRASGFDDLGRFHLGMFRANTPDGLRPTEIAERLGITKQSVNQALRDLESGGYLTLEPDPTDGRARVVRLTAEGRRLHELTYEAAVSAEQAIAQQLGMRRFSQFKEALEEINDQIENGSLQMPAGPAPGATSGSAPRSLVN
jgi:DNA-binding MarR family transcriptional regulator